MIVFSCLLDFAVTAYFVHKKLSGKQYSGKQYSGKTLDNNHVYIALPPVPAIPLTIPTNSRNRIAVFKTDSIPNEDLNNTTRQYCNKYNLDFIQLNYDKTDLKLPWMHLYHLLRSEEYEYVVLLLNSPIPLHPTSEKPVQRLIQQSGDSDLIAFRDASSSSELNTYMFIFKNSEWSQYKCAQLFAAPSEIQTLLLDQVYTTFRHKSLAEFKPELDAGLPYMLQCTCVYNEKACELNHNGKNVYPWTGVPGYVELERITLQRDERVYNQKIPKIIYQTMNTTLVNRDCNKFSVQAWKQLNPEYRYYYIDNQDTKRFLQKHFDTEVVNAYDLILPGAYQADMFRYCVLYVYGGCYVDSQTQPLMPLRDVINPDDEFVTAYDIKPYALFNCFLCCVPEHPALKLAIDKIVYNVKHRMYYKSRLKLTGPILLGMCLNKSLGRSAKKDLHTGLPSTVKILRAEFLSSTSVFINVGDQKFILYKYWFNLKQLETETPINIYDIFGKERYGSAHEKKLIFRRSLLIPNTFRLDPYCLKVYKHPFVKIRLGKQNDGGYVIVDIPQAQYDLYLSAYDGTSISFEQDFCKKYPNVKCNLYDGFLQKIYTQQNHFNMNTNMNSNIQFVHQRIGALETTKETNWHSSINRHDNLFVKMDMKGGGEFPWLESLSKRQLSKIAQLVIGFHFPNLISHERMFKKLNETHYLVHIHGCNFHGYTKHKHVLVPLVFVCTYLNKKYFPSLPELNDTAFPTTLDSPNNVHASDLVLKEEPFQFK